MVTECRACSSRGMRPLVNCNDHLLFYFTSIIFSILKLSFSGPPPEHPGSTCRFGQRDRRSRSRQQTGQCHCSARCPLSSWKSEADALRLLQVDVAVQPVDLLAPLLHFGLCLCSVLVLEKEPGVKLGRCSRIAHADAVVFASATWMGCLLPSIMLTMMKSVEKTSRPVVKSRVETKTLQEVSLVLTTSPVSSRISPFVASVLNSVASRDQATNRHLGYLRVAAE